MEHISEQAIRLSRLQNRIRGRKGLLGCGDGFSMALHSRGYALYAGADRYGQGQITACTDLSALVCDNSRAVGILRDGTLCLYGGNTPLDCRFFGLSRVRAVSLCGMNIAALLGNGQVVASYTVADTTGWPSVVDVVCGKHFVAGLTRDGRVIVSGSRRGLYRILKSKERIAGIFADYRGRTLYAITDEGRLLSTRPLPRAVEKWKNLVYVAANDRHIYGVTANGELLSTQPLHGNFPTHCHYVACAVSATHALALTRDGLLLADGANEFGQCKTSSFGALFSYFDEFSARRREQSRVQDQTERLYLARLTEAARYSSRLLCGRRVTACITADGRVLATGGFGACREWESVRAVSAGNAHLVALHENGQVSATGNDVYGCLDVGEWQNVKSIATGKYHTLGVTEDGRVLFCGRNHKGQGDVSDWTGIRAVYAADTYTVGLCYDGSIRIAGTPPFDPASIGTYWNHPLQIAVSETHMAALYANGHVLSTQRVLASARPGDGEVWNTCNWQYVRAIAVGEGFTVGLCYGGRVVSVCADRNSAWDLSAWENIVSISCGRGYVAGLTADGRVMLAGELQEKTDSSIAQTSLLLHPSLWQDVLCLQCGPHHLAAITRNGHVLAYGADGEGRCTGATHFSAFRDMRQLYGYGWYSQRLELELEARRVAEESADLPAVEEGIRPFSRISAYLRQDAEATARLLRGNEHILSVTSYKGENLNYEFRSRRFVLPEAFEELPDDPQEKIPLPSGAISASSSGRHTVYLYPDGHVEATGENDHGECETESWTRVIQVVAMPRLTLGLRADGSLLAAGYYHESIFTDEPIRAVAAFGRFYQVFVMADGTVRVHKKGSEIPPVTIDGLRLWDPLTEAVSLQRYVPGGLPFCTAKAAASAFAVGMGHTLTLGEEGVITAEGMNELGQRDIHTVGKAVAVAAGPYHSAAITPDGRVMLTGRNTDGECDHNALNRELEYSGAAYAFRRVACGYRHTVALRTDGRVFAVGAGHDGRCDTHKWREVMDIACGVRHTVAVTEQGSCLATGNNRYGQCDVTHFRGIVTVAAGEFHTVALRRDGRVLAAGDDRMGQCRVGDLQQIVSVACLPDATLCVRADGRVIIRGGSGIYDETIAALRDVVAIHACEYRIVALTADRRLIRIPKK